MVVPVKCVQYTYTASKTNLNFLWKVPVSVSETEILNKRSEVKESLAKEMPLYHTRAMRREFISSFGTVCKVSSGILREAYRRLTGDASAAHDASEAEVDNRIAAMLDLTG